VGGVTVSDQARIVQNRVKKKRRGGKDSESGNWEEDPADSEKRMSLRKLSFFSRAGDSLYWEMKLREIKEEGESPWGKAVRQRNEEKTEEEKMGGQLAAGGGGASIKGGEGGEGTVEGVAGNAQNHEKFTAPPYPSCGGGKGL